jgi:hypothetical protein
MSKSVLTDNSLKERVTVLEAITRVGEIVITYIY